MNLYKINQSVEYKSVFLIAFFTLLQTKAVKCFIKNVNKNTQC